MPDGYDMRRVAEVRAELGESPVWDEQKGVLYFVDITRGRIHVLLQNGRTETVYKSAARIGALALTDKGNLIFTEDAAVAMLELQAGEVSLISPAVHAGTGCRFNDGACDPQGRFISGLMHEGPNRNPGALYRFSRSGDACLIQQGIALPNGMAWSEDGNTFYFVDSIICSIFKATYTAHGKPAHVRLFARTPTGLGRPDGIALDKEGGLWVCQFNGGCLLRYDRNGYLSDHVTMPVPRPTSCCFGGDELGTLFITTARFAMTDSELLQYPDAGDLYAINPGISGNSRYRFTECR